MLEYKFITKKSPEICKSVRKNTKTVKTRVCSLELTLQINQEELITIFSGGEGRGELFSRNNVLALRESQPSLAVMLKSAAGPERLTQRMLH